eukprot:5858672-Pyramimonas_sp.AAC.1
MSREFTPGCSGCLGTSYRHSNFCLERRGLPPNEPRSKRAAAESAAAPEVKRAAVEEPESSADKRASDEA